MTFNQETDGAFRQQLSPIVRYFFVGMLTLFVANLLSSIVLAVAHAAAFLYHLGHPPPGTRRVLAAMIKWISDVDFLINWTMVLICAALLSFRSKTPSLGRCLAYAAGAWLSVLPFTLQPEEAEMHAVAPQVGRFTILLVLTLSGTSIGRRLQLRSLRVAEQLWTIREAQSPQQLVDAIYQLSSRLDPRIVLFSLEHGQDRQLIVKADSATNAPMLDTLSLNKSIPWSGLVQDGALVLKGNSQLPPPLNQRCSWWYVLRNETRASSILLIAPERRPHFYGSRKRFQAWADQACLSLRQQELVQAAQHHARDGERRQVSYEIHDSLAQDLISGLMQLEVARSHLGKVAAPVAGALDSVETTLRGALKEARQMTWKLHQNAPSQRSLRTNLQSALQEFKQNQPIEAEFLAVGDDQTTSPRRDAILLAGLREALTNIKKHAMARKVQVTLSHINGSVILDVCDNGRGLKQSALSAFIDPGGFGLPALRHRVEGAGGRLIVEAGPLGGTAVSIQFPAGHAES